MRRLYTVLSEIGLFGAIVLMGSMLALEALASDTLTIATAADFNEPLRELSAAFEKQTGIHLEVVTGPSGSLYEQIRNGAPFDIFMSADTDHPRKLVEEGLADQATLRTYAIGKLVLSARSDSSLRLSDINSILTNSSVTTIAVANPKTAPYGRAAVQAMTILGVYEKVSSKLVIGENVSQASQFVESGNAQVGFVALARVLSPALRNHLRYIEVPQATYDPIRQGLVVTNRAKGNTAASRFLSYLASPEATAILQRYGFTQ